MSQAENLCGAAVASHSCTLEFRWAFILAYDEHSKVMKSNNKIYVTLIKDTL
jgi:hypothetical protein